MISRVLSAPPQAPAAGTSRVRARAERALVVAVLAVRVTFVAQMLLAVIDGMARSDNPQLFAALVAAMVAESVLLCVVLLRLQAVTTAAAAADILFIMAMIAMEPLYSSPTDRVGTWVAWGFGAGTVASLSAGTGLRRLSAACLAGASLAAAYLAVSLPGAADTGMGGTALTNSVALVGFAVGSWVTGWFIRDLADVADGARAAAADSARRAAVDRQRILLHDQATVLSLLSQPGLRPETEEALRDQAARGSRRIRAFLAQEDPGQAGPPPGGSDLPLSDVLATVADEFADLPLTVNIDLVTGVGLGSSTGQLLAAALRTLLHNVRRHARATSVTLHADRPGGNSWEVAVRDDGIGFEPGRATGYGLGVQAGSALRAAGMQVTVDSAPGDGTTVTITGSLAGATL